MATPLFAPRRPRTPETLRAHVDAAQVVVRNALARAQANPSDEHTRQLEWAMRFECSKRDELDAALARSAA